MEIGIISDSHDRLPTLRRAVEVLRERRVGAVLHAGDFVAPFAAKILVGPGSPFAEGVPLYCIYGNNDGERAGLKKVLPMVQDGPLRVTLDGRTIVMHHGIDWLKPEDVAGADAVVTGHTHEVVNERRDGRLYLNPGECCGWLSGRCTIAVLDTRTMAVEIVDVGC